MATYQQSPFARADVPQLIGIRTNVAGYFFDAYLKLEHERELEITDHPVEEGANIADYSFVKPKGVSIEIGMSDVCSSFINGQFAERSTRSVSAFDTLERLQRERAPISLKTKLATYNNMLIENITASDDFTTVHGLRATVFFREIIVVSTATVTMPSRAPQKTAETNGGEVQPTTDSSILARAAEALSGNSELQATVDRLQGGQNDFVPGSTGHGRR